MLFVDRDLAHRIEATLSVQSRAFATASATQLGDQGATCLVLSEHAQAVYFGPGSVLSRVGGLGIGGAATVEQIEKAEEFFFSRGEDCKVELCPLADPSLMGLLQTRNYRVAGFVNVYLRETPGAGEDLSLPAGVSVRVGSGSEIERVLDVVHEGFGGKPGDPLRRQMGVCSDGAKRWHLGAYVEGSAAQGREGPVGGGGIEIIDRVALLYGASTLPAFRGRGVQAALLRARLAMARDAGCDLNVIQSVPGLASERNILRQGFRLAYTRPRVVRARSV